MAGGQEGWCSHFMACGRGILSSILNNSSSDKVEREFLENGSMLLEDLIAFSNGRYNIPIRRFSVKEICQATHRFLSDRIVITHGKYTIYEGCFEERLIYIKKYHPDGSYRSIAIRDIAMMSVMSSHKNVVKVLGCCLDFEVPALVCEYATGSILLSSLLFGTERRVTMEINGYSSLTWKGRLKIASEIANVVVYMHTAFPTPIIHRDLNPRNIIIDQCGAAKLIDFSLSISIPPGKTQVETTPAGTMGFLDPEYELQGIVTEKSDVYSFGMVLLQLLTGKRIYEFQREENHFHLPSCVEDYVDKNQLKNVVDPRILQQGEGGGIEQEQQFQAFAALALRCVQENGQDRPEMIEVAKELRRMYKSVCPSSRQP